MVNRNEKGQLQKGSVLNPKGRQPREKEHDYLDIMLNIVTPKRWATIVSKAADQAERGDAVARKWIADYIVGAPVQRQEVTGLEGGALEIIVTYENKPPTPEAP